MRLPPPPFWRTPYYQRTRQRPDRAAIADELIRLALATPTRREVQSDGRIRLWVYANDLGRWVRVVVLEDGETVHNAFLDRGFRT